MEGALRPRTAGTDVPGKHSQRLEIEASLLKAGLPLEGLLTASGNEKLTKSAVRFDDAKEIAAKESFKKQKQAWDSPPDTPRIPLVVASSPNKSQRTGIKKVSM